MMNFDNVPLLGESDTVSKDLSMYNNTTTVYWSPTRIYPGKRGGAYQFNAATKYIVVQDTPRFTLSNNYTISAWINPNDVADRDKGIMGTWNGAGFYFELYPNDRNLLAIQEWSSWLVSQAEIKEDGTRKHVAFVRSGSVCLLYTSDAADE